MNETERTRRAEAGIVAAHVERLARELDCTQADLAAVLGVSADTLSKYKTGRMVCPRWIVLRISICEARLGLASSQRDVLFPNCLRWKLHAIARETVSRVDKLIRRQAINRRALG